MKSRITLLILFCIALSSCSKWHGNGGGDDLDLKEENSVYEGYFYYTHLTEEMEAAETRIAELKQIIDDQQATNETYEELENQEEKLDDLTTERATIINLNSIVGIEIGPLPPCPDRECILPPDFLLKYIVYETGTLLSLKMIDEQQNEVNKTVKSGTVPNVNNLFRYDEIEIAEEIVGNVQIFVERLDSKGKIVSFWINGKFNN